MKKLIYLVVFILLTFCSDSLLMSQDKTQGNNKADDFYLRHIESAHPLPVYDEKIEFLVPLANTPKLFSSFWNINVTPDEKGTEQMQNESSIAANPVNPKNLIGSAVDYRDTSASWVYVSSDAGKSWVNIKLGRPFVGWTSSNDPSVAFGADGTGYLVYGGFGARSDGNTQGQVTENGIFISKTTDEGKTWKTHIPIILHRGQQTVDSTFEDKYYIWSDNSSNSPHKGDLYVPWKRVSPKDSATQIVISKSTDKGETWSSPVPVSPRLARTSEDTTYGQSFPLAVTGANGEVYVVWNNGIAHGVGFSKSTDGGKSFSTPSIIHNYNIFGVTRQISPGAWRHTVKVKVRAETYPSMVCDITNGPRKGYLYLTWCGDAYPNVYFSRSTDNGNSWSTPIIAHSDPTNDQFFQWLAIDNTNGDLALMYLDSRDDPNNILTATYVSYSSDGGIKWTDRRAADMLGDLRLNPFENNCFAGDYSGCAFHDGIVYPSWIDMRSAVKNIFDSDIYTAIVNINQPSAPNNFKANTIPDKPDRIMLSWNAVKEKAFGQPLSQSLVKYQLKRDSSVIADLIGTTTTYEDSGLEKFQKYVYTLSSYVAKDTSAPQIDSAWAGGSKLPGSPVLTGIGRDGSKVSLYYKLPALRLDGVTPLANMNSVNIYIDSIRKVTQAVLVSDTGKIVKVEYTVAEDGFYKIFASVLDGYASESPKSIDTTLYIGSAHTTYFENFDGSKPRLLLNKSWGLTNKFSYSTPNCLTDSPDGNYANSSNNYIVMYPYEGTAQPLKLKFIHACIVEAKDSVIVEYSIDFRKTWTQLQFWDKEQFAPWKDSSLNSQDWKPESLTIPQFQNDTVFIRFRLRTNVTKSEDGWYVDDISFQPTTDVEEETAIDQISVYPNPAVNFIEIPYPPLERGSGGLNIKIYDVFGQNCDLTPTLSTSGEGVRIDVSGLAPGMYFVRIGDRVSKFIKI